MRAFLFIAITLLCTPFAFGYRKTLSSNAIDVRFGDFMQEVRRHQKYYSLSNPNLVDLAHQLGLNLLVKAVEKVGMENMLDHEGPFTWFGPTDKAFQNAPKFCYNNPLRDVMQYHIAKGSFLVKSFENEQLLPALLAEREIRINIYHNGTVVTANGRIIGKKDQHAFNGQLNILGEMMCALYKGSALLEMSRCPTLNMFTEGVSLSEKSFANLLNGTEPLTVFAPTNDAVKKIPPSILDHLKNNKTALTEVMKNHVVMSTWYTAGFSDGLSLTSLHGKKLEIQGSSGNWVISNQAKLVLGDATVRNGVVHAIDTVLLPPEIKIAIENVD